MGPGWNGVLLHEAVGHGLEGDFNRKGISAFSGRIGERVAAPGVTVFDDGTVLGRRGSLTIDDEGTPTNRTVLIEDGILVGYMHDRMSARLMGLTATGNGRRQSYAHMPMARMTNTGMLGGDTPREEMIASVKRGLYCASFGGGQVDITNGKFVFQCTEAYLIEDGKITAPVKGATLIGDGPSALTRVTMIGDDFSFDPGVGVCGKNGQSVPVGVGQPSLKITGLTVGGTSGIDACSPRFPARAEAGARHAVKEGTQTFSKDRCQLDSPPVLGPPLSRGPERYYTPLIAGFGMGPLLQPRARRQPPSPPRRRRPIGR